MVCSYALFQENFEKSEVMHCYTGTYESSINR